MSQVDGSPSHSLLAPERSHLLPPHSTYSDFDDEQLRALCREYDLKASLDRPDLVNLLNRLSETRSLTPQQSTDPQLECKPTPLSHRRLHAKLGWSTLIYLLTYGVLYLTPVLAWYFQSTDQDELAWIEFREWRWTIQCRLSWLWAACFSCHIVWKLIQHLRLPSIPLSPLRPVSDSSIRSFSTANVGIPRLLDAPLRTLQPPLPDNTSAIIAEERKPKDKTFYLAHAGRQILARIRPVEESDGEQHDRKELFIIEKKVDEIHLRPLTGDTMSPIAKSSGIFMFHRAFGPSSSNYNVCEHLEPMVNASLELHEDFCIMIDGQSGAGKSWTLCDGPGNVTVSVAAQIFDCVAEIKRNGRIWTVCCTAVELYKNTFFDLLSPGTGPSGKVVAEKNGQPLGLANEPAISEASLIILLQRAYQARHRRATSKNHTSSRGFAVYTLTLSTHLGAETIKLSVVLVDLAGSER